MIVSVMCWYRITCAALLLAAAGSLVLPPRVAHGQPPTIAAASDLQFALDELAVAFAQEQRTRVEIVYASSGTLTRQIRDGAPFELFLSADEAFVADLARAGLARDGGTLYAVGRIVLFAPRGSPLEPSEGLDGLARLLERGGVTRLAIANPAHAPYGRAAEAALRARGLWTRLQPHLVLGENVSQAAQFATTGNAVGGVVALSLAVAPHLRGRGTFSLIPDDLHPPLWQRMALLRRAGPVAERFYAYLQQPAARAIFRRYGFTLPHERAERSREAPGAARWAHGPNRKSGHRRSSGYFLSGLPMAWRAGTRQTIARRSNGPEAGSPMPAAARRRATWSAVCAGL
jgi:molybdate transport system substrate-binding protein